MPCAHCSGWRECDEASRIKKGVRRHFVSGLLPTAACLTRAHTPSRPGLMPCRLQDIEDLKTRTDCDRDIDVEEHRAWALEDSKATIAARQGLPGFVAKTKFAPVGGHGALELIIRDDAHLTRALGLLAKHPAPPADSHLPPPQASSTSRCCRLFEADRSCRQPGSAGRSAAPPAAAGCARRTSWATSWPSR